MARSQVPGLPSVPCSHPASESTDMSSNSRLSVAVTGGAGFIGREVVTRLLDSGHGVAILDQKAAAATERFGDHVRWIDGSTRDAGAVSRALEGRDGVVHLAAGSS